MDGTLLDTLDDIADSTNAALKRMGCPAHPTEAYKLFVGDGIVAQARRALPEGMRDDATVARCVEEIRGEYGRRWADKTRPYEGIPDLLDALSARGVKLVVLSNKPDDFTRAMVAGLLPRWRFDAVVGSRPDAPVKPDPTVALEIALQLCVRPEDFFYVGDTNVDMHTAVGAGMYPVGALWGFRTREELIAAGARLLVEKPMDALNLLDDF